jgi:membrane-bound serine protease (ClpP class)
MEIDKMTVRLGCGSGRGVRLAAGLWFSGLLVLGCGVPLASGQEEEVRRAGGDGEHPWAGKVVVVKLTDAGLGGRYRMRVREIARQAELGGAAALAWEISTSRTSPDDSLDLAEELAGIKLPTAAWVKDRAYRGGAVFAFAAGDIYVADGARMGMIAGVGGEGVVAGPGDGEGREAVLAAELGVAELRARVASLCRSKGHREEVAAAMIDPRAGLEIEGEELAGEGYLILESELALRVMGGRPVLAAGQVDDVAGLVEKLVPGAGYVEVNPTTYSAAEVARGRPGAGRAEDEGGVVAVEDGEGEEEAGGAGERVAAKEEDGLLEAFRRAADEESFQGKVVVIEVGEEDLIMRPRFEFMTRMLQRAEREGAAAVIFDIDTPGGYAWATNSLMLNDIQGLTVPTYAFVNPRAISAGALISFSTDVIYMAPNGTIGSATPVSGAGATMGDDERAKYNAAFSGMARAAAKAKGHRAEVVEAMIDMNHELRVNGEVIVAVGEIAQLDAEVATMIVEADGRPLLAKGIARDLEDLVRQEGLGGELLVAEPLAMESFAMWVSKWGAILLLIGLAGGYLEMRMPGFGIAGAIALTAFSVYFFGYFLAGSLLGYEALALFVLGVVLIAVELFLVPGTLVAGLAGGACVLISLVMLTAGIDLRGFPGAEAPESGPTDLWAALRGPMETLAVVIVVLVGLALVSAKYLPESGFFRKLTLQAAVGGASAAPDVERVEAAMGGVGSGDVYGDLVGRVGLTESVLRPRGTVRVGGSAVEAVADSGFLDAGRRVRVLEARRGHIVVAEEVAGEDKEDAV